MSIFTAERFPKHYMTHMNKWRIYRKIFDNIAATCFIIFIIFISVSVERYSSLRALFQIWYQGFQCPILRTEKIKNKNSVIKANEQRSCR